MKKRYTLFILVLLSIQFSAFAQVGVNTTDPQAALDVRASNPSSPSNSDGLLIPRISAFPSTNPTASQDGMIVYLTTTVGTNSPGFYYWDNFESDWTSLGTGVATNAWNIGGNAGTDSGNNFIGTTDSEALVFKTNNENKLILTTKGQLLLNNTGRSVFIGDGAGANDDLSNNFNVFIGDTSGNATTTGDLNTAIGVGSLRGNITGSRNSAFGVYSLVFLESGNNNSSFGSRSSLNLVNGNFNAVFGSQSFRTNISGNFNSTLGARSLEQNESGNRNVSIGYRSLFDNIVGSDNIALGYNAGYFETGSNKLYIENSDSNTPLIGGDFSSNRMGVNVQVSSLTHTLTVGGDISATGDIETTGDFVTESNTYPDYVFEDYYNGTSEILPTYSFKTLKEVEAFIKTNGHLPGVKSYKEVEEEGFKIKLGTTSITNLEKIEESFLYIIELNNKLELQEKELQEKDQKIEELEQRLLKIEKMLEK